MATIRAQLLFLKAELEARAAQPDTLALVDDALGKVDARQELTGGVDDESVAVRVFPLLRAMMARQSHAVQMDLLGLMGDLEERFARQRAERQSERSEDSGGSA